MYQNKDNSLLYIGIGAGLFLILKLGEKIMDISQARKDFKLKMLSIADSIEKSTGIKPIITISQSAHESNWGLSELTAKANNLFGFTAEGNWEKAGKPVIKLPTTEYVNGKKITVVRPFRSYSSWLESTQDWARLISTLTRYAEAYTYAKAGSIDAYAVAVKKGGYATDIAYDTKLVAVAKTVNAITV